MLEEPTANEAEGEDEDVVCIHCLSGDAFEGNDILICEGAHSAIVGWHQLCLTPPLRELLAGGWFCADCVSPRSGLGSRLADLDYAPSRAATEAFATSSSTFNSNSDSSSNSGSSSSSNSTSDSHNDTDSNNDIAFFHRFFLCKYVSPLHVLPLRMADEYAGIGLPKLCTPSTALSSPVGTEVFALLSCCCRVFIC